MHRHDWNELPEPVRAAVRDRCGEVLHVHPVKDGRNADFAATLDLPFANRVFCKGAPADSPAARTFRFEARIGRHLPSYAPTCRWEVETAGWLVVGFDHVDGRHANLTPGSADIALVVDALAGCIQELTPSPTTSLPSLGQFLARVAPWRKLRDDPPPGLDPWTRSHLATFAAHEPAAAELASGHTLAHADIHELNLRVGDGVYVIDWAWAKLAAPWLDLSHLVIRLIATGHTPPQAEEWASRAAVWREAPPAAVTALAVEIYGLWEHLRHTDPRPFRDGPTRAARTWAMHRIGGS